MRRSCIGALFLAGVGRLATFQSGTWGRLAGLGLPGSFAIARNLATAALLGLLMVVSHGGNHHTRVNAMWTGGYEVDCRWYDALVDALQVAESPLVATALTLWFGVLGAAVKLTVADALWRASPE